MYVLDTNTISVFKNYYLDVFKSFWQSLDTLAREGRLLSSEEVYNELMQQGSPGISRDWAREHKQLFIPVNDEIGSYVAGIFTVPHFRHNLNERQISSGRQVADPFVVATAQYISG